MKKPEALSLKKLLLDAAGKGYLRMPIRGLGSWRAPIDFTQDEFKDGGSSSILLKGTKVAKRIP